MTATTTRLCASASATRSAADGTDSARARASSRRSRPDAARRRSTRSWRSAAGEIAWGVEVALEGTLAPLARGGTKSDGTCRFEMVPAGSSCLVAKARDGTRAPDEVAVAAGERRTVDFRLAPR